MHTLRRLLAATFLVLTAASFVWAQSEDPLQVRNRTRTMVNAFHQSGVSAAEADQLVGSMWQHRFRMRHMEQVQAALGQLAADGLTGRKAADKIKEGMAKGVAPENIADAVDRVVQRQQKAMRAARVMTQNRNRIQRLQDLVYDALASGIEPDDLDEVENKLQRRQRNMNRVRAHELAEQSMLTLREMARLGTASGATCKVVEEALDNGYQPGDMEALRNRFREQLRTHSAENLAMQFQQQIRGGANRQSLGSGGTGQNGGMGGGSGSGGGGGNSGGGGGGGAGGHGGGRP